MSRRREARFHQPRCLLPTRRRLAVGAVSLSCGTAAAGQCVPDAVLAGKAVGEHFADVAAIGDVDGDEITDFVVGAHQSNSGGPGQVSVYSGATAALLYWLDGEHTGDLFGAAVAGVGDMSGDGLPDFAVPAPGYRGAAGRVYIFSGFDGQLVFALTGPAPVLWFGLGAAGLGDVDGDGFGDVALGTPLFDGCAEDCGRVEIYSSQDQSVLYTLAGEQPHERFGQFIASLDDLDGDGIREFSVGSPGHDGPVVDTGRACVHSGADGSIMHEISGSGPFDWLGASIAPMEDVDGDQVPDFAIASGGGMAAVYSGATGAELYCVPAGCAPDLAPLHTVRSAGDFNGDGFRDVLLGVNYDEALGPQTGRAFVFSGFDQTVIAVYTGLEAGDHFGWSAAGLGDVDGDGFDDVLIGASDGNGPGYVHIERGAASQSSDLDRDGTVGILDFLDLLGSWGPCKDPGSCPSDLNTDGAVDRCDFDILLANWS